MLARMTTEGPGVINELTNELTDELVDFGFTDVPRAAKRGRVGEIFTDVARRYDLMNDLMSLGIHRGWKAALIDRLQPRPGMTLLDVAGGTGDVARGFIAQAGRRGSSSATSSAKAARALVCDINIEMTTAGRDRAIDQPIDQSIGWHAAGDAAGPIAFVCGDAEELPLPDRQFDAVTIAFGLRNVTDRAAAIAEARRVLRPGGQYLVLEFSPVALPLIGEAYERYSFDIVPQIGRLVTGNREAYQYLVESIRRFPDPDALSGEIAAAGLGRISHQPLSGGIARIHSSWRI